MSKSGFRRNPANASISVFAKEGDHLGKLFGVGEGEGGVAPAHGAGNVASMLIFALAASRHQLVLLFASRMLAGATAGNLGACQAAIADVTSGPERSKAMGKIGAGIALGVMFGPVFGGWASKLGEVGPPLIAAALAFVALLGVMAFLPETNANIGVVKERATRPPLSSLGSNPKLLLILALYFMTFLYMSNLQVALPLLADARLHWTGPQLGNVFGLFGLVMFLVQAFGVGVLSSRIASSSIITMGALISTSALVTIAIATTPVVLLAGCVLLALGLGVTQPLMAALASECAAKAQQGVMLGFAQSSGGLARTVGPVLWGTLYGRLGPGASFLGGAVAALVACGIGIALRTLPTPDPEPA